VNVNWDAVLEAIQDANEESMNVIVSPPKTSNASGSRADPRRARNKVARKSRRKNRGK
jgi:hypothetical protein